MQRYIALLGGINVGGHRVKMAHLRALFEALGFEHVETLIASGNVIFETARTDVSALETQIAIGPCIMSLFSTGSSLPLKGRSGNIALGVRYLRSFSGTLGAFAGVEHTGGASVTVTDYDGKAIEDAAGIPLKLDWNSTRFRVGLFTRF